MSAHEYHLVFWGEIVNDGLATRLFGPARDFWFDTPGARRAKKHEIQAVAQVHGVRVAFAEYEGAHVRLRTIARMEFALPDGRQLPLVYDFGFGYPPESARYMFEEGNYSCDCNRADFLGLEADHPCGDEIKMTSLAVTQEPVAG